MTESRNALLRKISAHEFAAWEIQIFLDTHPEDQMALTQKQQHEQKVQELKDQYQQEYGMLTAQVAFPMQHWEWIDDPWPWDAGMEETK